jgi:hypothetical protein
MRQGLDAFGHHNPGPGSPARRRIGLLASVLLAAAVSTTGLAVTASTVEGSIGGSTVGSATGILTSAMTWAGAPSSTAPLQNPVATVRTASTTTVPLPTPTTTLPGASAQSAATTTLPMALPVVATTTPTPSVTRSGVTTTTNTLPSIAVARGSGSVDLTPVAPAPSGPLALVSAATADQTTTRDCNSDPSALISALPWGGTFHGHGCYSVNNGIKITKPVTLDGGIYIDSNTTPPPFTGHGQPQLNPIIDVVSTGHVTLENLVVQGTNADGSYHPALVGQAGIKLQSTRNTVITNVTTSHTFGDGLELWFDTRPGYGYPVTDLTVNGLTVWEAGRQGITFGNVSGATLNNVRVLQAADSGIDFESDLPHVGSGNVTIANSTICYCGARTSINSIDYLSGPVQLTNDTLAGHFVVENPQSANGFTMTGGSLALPRVSPGTPPSGIFASRGAHIRFIEVKFSLLPGTNRPDGRNLLSTDTSTISVTR